MREVFHNPALRRLQLAWAGSIIGSWAYAVALVVYAYDQGGASAVGLVALIRWLPAAVASPLSSSAAGLRILWACPSTSSPSSLPMAFPALRIL